MSMAVKRDCYRDKHLLVTGSSGFIAANLIAALSNTRCTIRRLSRQGSHVLPMHGNARIEDMTGDIRDRRVWEHALEGIDTVFHFAAQTSVPAAADDPFADLDANVLPMLNMLETCRRKRLHPVVLFSGTVTEAGMTTSLPVNETQPDTPITVYDLHKLMAEQYLKYYAGQGLVRGAALRLANVYGPGTVSSGAERGVLNAMIQKALAGEALTIYGHGEYVRDYVYVTDVVDAFLAAGSAIDRLNGGHFVIGSGRGHTVAEAVTMVVEQVGRRLGHRVAVMHLDPPRMLSSIEERNFVADPGRFSGATGWQAHTPLAEGIDLTIASFLGKVKAAR